MQNLKPNCSCLSTAEYKLSIKRERVIISVNTANLNVTKCLTRGGVNLDGPFLGGRTHREIRQ